MSISCLQLVRKHSNWDHRKLVEFVFIARHWTLGSMPGVGLSKTNTLAILTLWYSFHIMITSPYGLYPLASHFYIVKLGFTGVYMYMFLIFAPKTYTVGTSYSRVPTIYVLSKNMKIVKKIQLKIVIFTAVKNRCILHGRVFVMITLMSS